MTAQEFYEEFKESLNYLGVGFAGMEDAEVFIENGRFGMSANGKETLLVLPKSGEV
jgi:hypothetical protein